MNISCWVTELSFRMFASRVQGSGLNLQFSKKKKKESNSHKASMWVG